MNFQINTVGKLVENNKYCLYNRIVLIKSLEFAFMTLFKKSLLFFLSITFFVSAARAKDSVGIMIQVGAIGSEKTYYSSSTLSGGTISMPYSKTTFSPDFYFGIGIPVCDIGEICFFGFDFGYNCSLKYSYSLFSTSESESYVFSHKISFMPEFTFVKSNFRFYVGTGFAFGFEPYQYESASLGVKTVSDSNSFKIFWTFETGVKYKLGKHLFAVADITFFVTAFEEQRDHQKCLCPHFCVQGIQKFFYWTRSAALFVENYLEVICCSCFINICYITYIVKPFFAFFSCKIHFF